MVTIHYPDDGSKPELVHEPEPARGLKAWIQRNPYWAVALAFVLGGIVVFIGEARQADLDTKSEERAYDRGYYHGARDARNALSTSRR